MMMLGNAAGANAAGANAAGANAAGAKAAGAKAAGANAARANAARANAAGAKAAGAEAAGANAAGAKAAGAKAAGAKAARCRFYAGALVDAAACRVSWWRICVCALVLLAMMLSAGCYATRISARNQLLMLDARDRHQYKPSMGVRLYRESLEITSTPLRVRPGDKVIAKVEYTLLAPVRSRVTVKEEWVLKKDGRAVLPAKEETYEGRHRNIYTSERKFDMPADALPGEYVVEFSAWAPEYKDVRIFESLGLVVIK